jgi:hypothetical protein
MLILVISGCPAVEKGRNGWRSRPELVPVSAEFLRVEYAKDIDETLRSGYEEAMSSAKEVFPDGTYAYHLDSGSWEYEGWIAHATLPDEGYSKRRYFKHIYKSTKSKK